MYLLYIYYICRSQDSTRLYNTPQLAISLLYIIIIYVRIIDLACHFGRWNQLTWSLVAVRHHFWLKHDWIMQCTNRRLKYMLTATNYPPTNRTKQWKYYFLILRTSTAPRRCFMIDTYALTSIYFVTWSKYTNIFQFTLHVVLHFIHEPSHSTITAALQNHTNWSCRRGPVLC